MKTIAQIQTLQRRSSTYKTFAQKFIKSLPTGFIRVDLIADTYYRIFSNKSSEWKSWGEASKVLIKSAGINNYTSRLLKTFK
jgi:hypothetical protein